MKKYKNESIEEFSERCNFPKKANFYNDFIHKLGEKYRIQLDGKDVAETSFDCALQEMDGVPRKEIKKIVKETILANLEKI